MRRFTVKLTSTVDNQILDEALFVSDASVQHAVAWDARVRSTLSDHLGNAPRGYPLDERETRRAGRETRRYVFERVFVVHYCIDDLAEMVVVVNFRHGARDGNEPSGA